MKNAKRICALALSLVIMLGALPFGLSVEAEAAYYDRMTSDIAQAYLDVIENKSEQISYCLDMYGHAEDSNVGFIGGFLCDLGGNEWPELIIAAKDLGAGFIDHYYYLEVWGWNGSKAVQASGNMPYDYLDICTDGDRYFFRTYIEDPSGMSAPGPYYYKCENLLDGFNIYDFTPDSVEVVERVLWHIEKSNYGHFEPNGKALIQSLKNEFPEAESPAPAAPATADPSAAREAYREYAQQLVNKYGMYECGLNMYDHPENSGVVGSYCMDVTGDGVDEFYLAIVYPDDIFSVRFLMYDYATNSKRTLDEFTIHNSGTEKFFDLRRDAVGNPFAEFLRSSYVAVPYIWDGDDFYTIELDPKHDPTDFKERCRLLDLVCTDGPFHGTTICFSVDFYAEIVGIQKEDGSYERPSYFSCSDQTDTLTALGVTLPTENEAPTDDPAALLYGVSYVGDAENCGMSAAQAKAFAEVLESYGSADVRAVLFDAGGIPAMFVMSSCWGIFTSNWGNSNNYDFGYPEDLSNMDYNFHLWQWDGSAAVEYRAFGDDGTIWSKGFSVEEWTGSGSELVSSTFYPFVGGMVGPESDIADRGYELVTFGIWDGAIGGNMSCDGFTAPTGNELASALRAYAEAASGTYSFPKAEEVDDEALVESIAKAVADAVGGEISGIYKLADGIYYVLITVDGSARGTLVTGSRENGKTVWSVGDTDSEPLSEEELKAILAGIQSKSNLTLDFSAIGDMDNAETVDALRGQLDNMDGLMPTDPAKAQIADYIQSAISSNATITLPGSDNRFTPDPEAVDAIRAEAEKAKGEYDKLLEEYGIELNRPITVIIRIVWVGMDSGKACQIELNDELLAAMSDCEVQLLLGDTRHYVRVGAEALGSLVDTYGCVKIQMALGEDGVYTIHFLDANDNRIERLETPVGFGLPAETPLATVVVGYEGGSLNWGGQYDPNAKVISFDASYSGQYEIFENSADIGDISELDDETRSAIAFLVSKGYMSLTDGLFRPNAELSRYQFSQALVGMFFALDPSLSTGFEDVPADSPFYSYVASGENLDIIKGYDDTRFGGDDSITTEQMLSLAARTLINYKHYAEPGDPDSYLSAFSDGSEVSEWARSEVALAIREGLIDRGGELGPEDSVSRSEAALILYRLFLLLHEVPAVELELPEVSEKPAETPAVIEDEADKAEDTEEDGGKAGTVIAIIIILLAVGGAAAWWFLKKKKSPAAEKSGEN